MKTIFLFPGQGAQFVGMGQDFLATDWGKEMGQRANKCLGFDLIDIMLNGPEEKLKETQYTQPAILFHSMLALEAARAANWQPIMAAGHSLGEFSALTAAGVFTLEDALQIVHQRGRFMIEANDGTPFKMSAILGLSNETVASFCREAQHTVVPANFNSPVQVVISGTAEGVDEVNAKAQEAGAKKVIELKVGGPFHSPLIAQASEKLAEALSAISLQPATFPVISNVTAQPEADPEEIRSNLAKQVVSSVRWTESMHYILEQEKPDLFIEFGPGKVLRGLLRGIDKKAKSINIADFETLQEAEAYFNQ